jgi:hypothetical protein
LEIVTWNFLLLNYGGKAINCLLSRYIAKSVLQKEEWKLILIYAISCSVKQKTRANHGVRAKIQRFVVSSIVTATESC